MYTREKAVKDFGIIKNLRLQGQRVAHRTILEMHLNIVHQNQILKSQFYSSQMKISHQRISK